MLTIFVMAIHVYQGTLEYSRCRHKDAAFVCDQLLKISIVKSLISSGVHSWPP
jgi:hypothetical protein